MVDGVYTIYIRHQVRLLLSGSEYLIVAVTADTLTNYLTCMTQFY